MRSSRATKYIRQVHSEDMVVSLLDDFCRQHVDAAVPESLEEILQQFDALAQTPSRANECRTDFGAQG